MLAYISLSFTIQVIALTGQLAKKELHCSLAFPRVLAPETVQLQQGQVPELVLEVRLPNVLFGVQVFWELRLYDAQQRQAIHLRYRLQSGANRVVVPLLLGTSHTLSPAAAAGHRRLLAQFRRGLYRGASQGFLVRDFLSCLCLRYQIGQPFELAVLSASSVIAGDPSLPANPSQDPLRTDIQKFAQEGLSEQRPYYPGDDPRRINWKLYSRFDELYVRIPEEQQQYSQDIHCCFVLDMACYPRSLRPSVLDAASTYFLAAIKQLHQHGYRILLHIPSEPANWQPAEPSQAEAQMLHSGLLYWENNEETTIRALAAYPLDARLAAGKPTLASRTRQKPLLDRFFTDLAKAGLPASSSYMVFVSPHSPKYALQSYFPAGQSVFVPLPEPSAALKEQLLGSPLSPLRLLPATMLGRWLLRPGAATKLPAGSPAHRLYQQCGIHTASACPTYRLGRQRSRESQIVLQGQTYPQLLLRLHAWQRYYRKPERRY